MKNHHDLDSGRRPDTGKTAEENARAKGTSGKRDAQAPWKQKPIRVNVNRDWILNIFSVLVIIVSAVFIRNLIVDRTPPPEVKAILADREIFDLDEYEEDKAAPYQLKLTDSDGGGLLLQGKYLGKIKSGIPHGQGVFAYLEPKTGTKYLWIGEWKNGVFEGKGEQRRYQPEFAKELAENYANLASDAYKALVKEQYSKIYITGTFKNFWLNGRGKFYFADGSVSQEGEYLDQKLNGQGKIYRADGKLWKEGEFRDGKLNGQGKTYLKDKFWAEGEYKDDELNGQGKTYFDGKLSEEGEFRDGKLNGQGKKYYLIGGSEEGEYKDGLLNGQGKKYDQSGKLVEEGTFRDGELNGQGKKYDKSVKMWQEGEFVDGELKAQQQNQDVEDRFMQEGKPAEPQPNALGQPHPPAPLEDRPEVRRPNH